MKFILPVGHDEMEGNLVFSSTTVSESRQNTERNERGTTGSNWQMHVEDRASLRTTQRRVWPPPHPRRDTVGLYPPETLPPNCVVLQNIEIYNQNTGGSS